VSSKRFWCGVLIVVLSLVLAEPAEASGYPSAGAIVGGIAAVAAAVVIIAVVVIHKSTSKRTITGCVSTGGNGLSIVDDKDKKSYSIAGNTTGIQPGERVTLQGKKIKTQDNGKALVWKTKQITQDYGVCQP
jgi:hypothetical protein